MNINDKSYNCLERYICDINSLWETVSDVKSLQFSQSPNIFDDVLSIVELNDSLKSDELQDTSFLLSGQKYFTNTAQSYEGSIPIYRYNSLAESVLYHNVIGNKIDNVDSREMCIMDISIQNLDKLVHHINVPSIFHNISTINYLNVNTDQNIQTLKLLPYFQKVKEIFQKVNSNEK